VLADPLRFARPISFGVGGSECSSSDVGIGIVVFLGDGDVHCSENAFLVDVFWADRKRAIKPRSGG
jgi:hypothetical protein